MNYSKIRAFTVIDSFNAKTKFEDSIKKEIDNKSKEYILSVDEDEYKEYIIKDFSLEPLIIHEESERIDKPLVKKEQASGFPREYVYEIDVYFFTVHYSFSGSAVLFKIRPSSWVMTSYDITVSESTREVSFTIKVNEQNPDKFFEEKKKAFNAAFTNIVNVNSFANEWNKGVKEIVNRIFDQTKNKFLKENDFYAAINIPTNKGTDSIFTVPTIKKTVIPQPKIDKNKEFVSVPTMSKTMYSDIIKVIYDAGKSMEKKPSLYLNKDEEGLRDQFLLFLETRYESTTATGETFNKKGKTDIILKYSADNSNIFVAECKFWKGASEFHNAIDQLFDRYLTWRDSKTALLFFVTNKDFSNVLELVKKESIKHKYFKNVNGQNGESSFSYLYRLPNDENKIIYLEIILFHFN